MKLIPESHVDHALTPEQLAFVLGVDAPDGDIYVQTIEMPEELGTLPCALYGPLMGDAPVTDAFVTMKVRGDRKGPSRMVDGRGRQTRLVTIVSGPGPVDPCVLYTSYGGPDMPREPFEFADDDTSEQAQESREKWATHALCK